MVEKKKNSTNLLRETFVLAVERRQESSVALTFGKRNIRSILFIQEKFCMAKLEKDFPAGKMRIAFPLVN